MPSQLNLGAITKSGQMELSPGEVDLVDVTLHVSDGLIQLKSVEIPVMRRKPGNFSRMGFYDPSQHLTSVAEIIYSQLSPDKCNSVLNLLGISYKDTELMDIISTKFVSSVSRLLTVAGGPKAVPEISSTLDGIDRLQKLTGDVIICRHILEHLEYPEKFLDYLQNVMDEKGLLFIEVPDASKIYRGFLYPDFWDEHKFYFNQDSLRNLLQKVNFQILRLETMETEAEDVIVCVAAKDGSERKINVESSSVQTLDELSYNIDALRNRIQIDLGKGLVFGFIGATHASINFIDMFFDRKESCNIFDNHEEKIGKFVTKFSLPIQPFTRNPASQIDIWATSLSRKRFEMYYPNFDHKKEIVKLSNL